tara:strand:- start:1267 stop:2310 length:1044 start_codon:yes stop_codon:yes gene_type:complete
MRESDLIVPLGIAGILAGLKGVQNRQMSEVERLNQIALQSQEEEEDKSPEPEITDRTVFDEEGNPVGEKGSGGLFDFSGYHDPIHNLITIGDDPESFSNNLSDFLIGTEAPVYDETGTLISGDPNSNIFNTAGALGYLPMMRLGIPGAILGGAGMGYSALSSFAPEFTQQYIDQPVGKAYEYSKDRLGDFFSGVGDSYNDFMNYEGYKDGGRIHLKGGGMDASKSDFGKSKNKDKDDTKNNDNTKNKDDTKNKPATGPTGSPTTTMGPLGVTPGEVNPLGPTGMAPLGFGGFMSAAMDDEDSSPLGSLGFNIGDVSVNVNPFGSTQIGMTAPLGSIPGIGGLFGYKQ